ncbi:hypothetical protein NEMBOFW57_007694 [Staphylotrichum longicolle]|uniref:Tyrosinase copper-binding domain-containing protein n=1 Tax=Staphylotrichum longicolle TaxID=669026 RepID=A0AAD4HVC4_9PEZI|nr:hypothetical protein NEMBOFW57_007694 [Staphylotrichum longicolle]
MKLLVLLASALLAGSAAGAPTAQIPKFTQAEIDSGKAIRELGRIAYENALARAAKATTGCTRDKVRIRKEWRNMTLTDRKGYQEAVQCLMQKPARHKGLDGVRTAWDDYGALHYYQTPYVHNSATFLLWHRHYNWVLEQDLRDICGYTGVFPYWEWGLDCGSMGTIDKSPVFDGSEYSLGGNGKYVAGHQAAIGGARPGTGGGCLTSGPFSNFTVNMGPVGSRDPLKYNPRCIKRDLNTDVCNRWATLRNTTDPILNSADIAVFQAVVQGDGRWPAAARVGIAVHGGGHYAISGDPGSDFYFSALEPGFYLHHGNIDRMHFIWQNLDWENRQTISGTNTMYNSPPTPEAVLTDNMGFEPLNRNVTIKQTMDTVGGTPLCYVYEPW